MLQMKLIFQQKYFVDNVDDVDKKGIIVSQGTTYSFLSVESLASVCIGQCHVHSFRQPEIDCTRRCTRLKGV